MNEKTQNELNTIFQRTNQQQPNNFFTKNGKVKKINNRKDKLYKNLNICLIFTIGLSLLNNFVIGQNTTIIIIHGLVYYFFITMTFLKSIKFIKTYQKTMFGWLGLTYSSMIILSNLVIIILTITSMVVA